MAHFSRSHQDRTLTEMQETALRMTNAPTLFQNLGRWAHRQDENFTTDAFAFILQYLLQNDTPTGLSLLGRVCALAPSVFGTNPAGELSIDTQCSYCEGRPDLKIESSRLLAFVEVRKESGLGSDQVSRYRSILGNLGGTRQTQLVVLSKYPIAFPDGQETPDHHLRWQDVSDCLETSTPGSAVSQFLCQQFVQFLKDRNMAFERVDWQYLEGYRAFRNLPQLLAAALEIVGVEVKTSTGNDWTGFDTKDGFFWVGIPHNRHHLVLFEVQPRAPIDGVEFKKRCEVHDSTGKLEVRLDLTSDTHCFFSKNKDGQLSIMTEFLRTTHRHALECLTTQVVGHLTTSVPTS